MASTRSNGRKQQSDDRAPPVFSKRFFTGSATVEVAVFSRMVETDNGSFEAFSTTVKRTYREGDEYKTSASLRPEDLPVAAALLLDAFGYVTNMLNKK